MILFLIVSAFFFLLLLLTYFPYHHQLEKVTFDDIDDRGSFTSKT